MRRCGVVLLVVFGVVLVAMRSPARAQADECLVEFQDDTGSLADGTTLTQTAQQKKCKFDLKLCTNVLHTGCTAATFAPKKFHATGHCGPVAKLQVTATATGSVCGAFTGITVRTKKNGKKEGKCALRASAKTAKTQARKDVDKLTLLCEP